MRENLGFLIVSVLVILLSYALSRGNRRRTAIDRLKLPPGSMGWPFIGETLQLYSQDPGVFFSVKQMRYGEIFKTHILGCPCVMLASPEAAKFVLVSQAKLFKPTYPRSKERLIGPSALFFHQNDYHLHLRKLVQHSFSLDAIRHLVPKIEAIAASVLEPLAGGQVINTFQEMKKFSFQVGILAIFTELEIGQRDELEKNYFILDKGYNSFPTNIPATPYKKAMLARARLSEILKDIIRERREEKRVVKTDLLGSLVDSKDKHGDALSDIQIADNIIGVLFAAQDTTASVITWILKYLHQNPKLLESVKEEQKTIQELNKAQHNTLSLSRTRNMPITYKVVLESMRMASIISFTFREAVADIEYKGYLIPKGWKVMPLFRNIHHSPDNFIDRHKFDPFRFEVAQKPNTFMPFGSGIHVCPGNELAKLEILLMIHHLVTKFRWEPVGPESGVQYGPFPLPLHGFPSRFWTDVGED